MHIYKVYMLIYPDPKRGPGKSMYTFSAERLLLSAPRQASVGRASRQGGGAESGRRLAENIYIDLP